MKITKYKIRDTRYESAFTIAELLISLAISALLLVAIAVAFNGSVTSYQQNEDMYKAINNARQAIFRITTQLRTAESVNDASPINQCNFRAADGQVCTYDYRSNEKKLYLVTVSGGLTQSHLLCDNVTAMTFTKNTAIEGPYIIVKSVQIQ